jgi:O-antigen ligase
MKIIRIGIGCLLTFAVFAHGAVEAWSEAVLVVGASFLLVLWAVLISFGRTRSIRWDALLAPLAALAAFGMVQWLFGLTASSYLTRIELLKFSAILILVFLAVQAFRTTANWVGFAWYLLVLAFVVSVFGILQHFTFNGKLYWLRELRYGGIPFGPYVNRNHFAGLVELIAPLGLAILMLRGVRRDQLPLVALFTLLPVGALFLASSRGGITSFLAEVALLGLLIWARRGMRRSLAAAAAIVMLAAGVVAWLGVGRALDRFTSFQKLEVSEARRVSIVKDAWRIFLDHPVRGTGLGTLQVVFPRYESMYDGKVANHAHNDYVELLAETGVIGALCFATFLFLLFRRSWDEIHATLNPQDLALRMGALVACAGLLVHSFVDFNLHIPSNALLFYLLAVVASSAARPDQDF